MANPRLSGSGSYLYAVTLGTVESGPGALANVDGWYKIGAIGSTGTGWPTGAQIGDVIFNSGTGITMDTGDEGYPMTLTKVGFVTDVPHSATKEKYDETVQTDSAMSYEEGDKPEISGNMNGFFVLGDATVDAVLARFFTVITDDDAGNHVITEPVTGVLHFMLSRRETTVSGEVDMFQYLPVIIDSAQIDKPMQGKQPFSLGCTVVGGERPNFYKRTVA